MIRTKTLWRSYVNLPLGDEQGADERGCGLDRHRAGDGKPGVSRGAGHRALLSGTYTQFRPVSVEVGSGKLRLSVDLTHDGNFPLPTSRLTG